MSRTLAFVGSLNRLMPNFPPAHGAGIGIYAFDEATGRLSHLNTYEDIDNPAFLAIDAAARRLYAVTEWPGRRNEGLVTAFSIDPDTGSLTHINMQPTEGSTTCHVSIAGGYLFASNFTLAPLGSQPGAAVTVFPLRGDGGIGPSIARVAHEGRDAVLPVAARSHAHSATASPDGGHVLVPDLGLDRVMSYRLPPENGTLALADEPFLQLAAKTGPRHLLFADGNRVYFINELNSTVTFAAFDPATGGLAVRQHVPTLPAATGIANFCAELALSSDGRFLYATNRGHDSIVRFAIDAEGRLGDPQWTSSNGNIPRNLAIDPSGRFVLVSNQAGDNVVIYRRDTETGLLADTGNGFVVGTPMRIVFGRFD